MNTQALSKSKLIVEPSGANDARPNYLRIVDQLRTDIIDGVIPPGARLKTEELARRYGVSIQPIREALQVLNGEGLIVLEPNRGATVRGLDQTRLEHIYGLREAIEGYLTQRFAEEASLSDIRHLESIQALHDAATEARDPEELRRTNMLFHKYICEHSQNTEAIAIQQRYILLGESMGRRFGFDSKRWPRVQNDHHTLIEACRRRDGVEAYLIASRHVRTAKEELFARMKAHAEVRKPNET